MKKPKVFLCWTLNSGTSFYRMMNPSVHMKDKYNFMFSKWSPDFQEVADWEYKINSKTDAQVAKDLDFLTNECDMVISQKFHSVGGLALMKFFREKFPKKPWFTDFDDNCFSLNPSSPAYEIYNPGSAGEMIIRDQIQMSTGLIVSTENLREVYERINPNIYVVPNGIDFSIWEKLKKPSKTKKIRIGWAGGGSHLDDLEFIEPAVTRISKKFSNVEFVFLGGVHPNYKDKSKIKAITKWYGIDKYPQALADLNLDIALAPLRDNEFNRAKSNLRYLEYSALGIPTIASNVTPFKMINSGKDGLLVTEVDEWENAMSELITNQKMRKDMGKEAFLRVKKDYNIVKIADKYCDNLKDILAWKMNVSTKAMIDAVTSLN